MKHSGAASALILLSLLAFPCPDSAAQKTGGKNAAPWDTYSDTWAATDALGRSLPDYAEAGPPRAGKFVAIFYFLWLGEHGTDGPFDITEILARDPEAINNPTNPLWGPLSSPHHWGKSAFGYYLSHDEWVLRKHAQMLCDAGVDAVFFDVTNQSTYPRSYLALCRVWTQIRREGGKTPQIAFLTPFWDPAGVVQALYRDLYKPGLYADLWFRWEGKPLILAKPEAILPERLRVSRRVPGSLQAGETVGQSFTTKKPFTAVGGEFPTYKAKNSGMTLTLRRGGPSGAVLARRRFENVVDNAAVLLQTPRALPPGTYYLEQSEPKGQIGWWSETGDVMAAGRAYSGGLPAPGDRSLQIRYVGAAGAVSLSSGEQRMTLDAAQKQVDAIRRFFTFRAPQPDYFTGPTGPGQWGWLDVHPQKPYFKMPGGAPEQMTVGVAQNAVDGKLGALSNPRAHGRSFAGGKQPGPSGQDFTGRNFAEQWKRAREVDPSLVFVTGWNEWIAGRFGADAPFHGAGPVTFVDTFNHEYSRDIEPVSGGHTDSYYYQLVDNIRRFKGVRAPATPAPRRTMTMDGSFRDWQNGGTEYRDDRFDTAHRNQKGWGKAGVYRNQTGRNDFIRARAAHDEAFLYFYAQTREPFRAAREGLLLLLETGGEALTYRVNFGTPDSSSALLEASSGGGKWRVVSTVRFRRRGNELELAVPRKAVGSGDVSRPLQLDFKWMDNVGAEKDPLNVYRNGDTAPNGRFRYRYSGEAAVTSPQK